MLDFQFDFVNREIVLSEGTHGDFVTTSNPSDQIAVAMAYSRGVNLRNPTVGIGIQEIENAGAGEPTGPYEMNRWKAQIAADGGRGTWKQLPGPGFNFQMNVNYLPT